MRERLTEYLGPLELVGARWIIESLDQLRTQLEGISHKILTQTLRGLERDGLAHRTVYAEVPPRVDYRLTEAGGTLRETVNGRCAWTRRYLDEIEAARRRFDAKDEDKGQDKGKDTGAGQ
ncbi:winged helix-turn-helix transcriptional regulator [Streptomyces sp. NPDC088400]|uniref:winged helix-turn-helix transcriptional regulator n=1 Tax=Streptomyces sp. NPDC088400 TaxID=3365861 RepID=UPI00381FD00A